MTNPAGILGVVANMELKKGHLRCSDQENKGLEYQRVNQYRYRNHQQ